MLHFGSVVLMHEFDGIHAEGFVAGEAGGFDEAKIEEDHGLILVKDEQGIEHVVEEIFVGLLPLEELSLDLAQLVGGDSELAVEVFKRPAWGPLLVGVFVAASG